MNEKNFVSRFVKKINWENIAESYALAVVAFWVMVTIAAFVEKTAKPVINAALHFLASAK